MLFIGEINRSGAFSALSYSAFYAKPIRSYTVNTYSAHCDGVELSYKIHNLPGEPKRVKQFQESAAIRRIKKPASGLHKQSTMAVVFASW